MLAPRLRRLVGDLRTEGAGPVREALAVGSGVFIGCSPLYGFHLLLCLMAGWCFGLNRLKMYLAANISNPLMAPFILLAEVEIGAWLQRGEMHALTIEAVRATDPWTFGADLIVGSLVLGAVLGVAAGAATLGVSRSAHRDPWFDTLATRAADRYIATSITAWEFARGKLRGDPVYRTMLARSLVRPGTVVDVGCGQGLTLALLAEACAARRAGTWPDGYAPPPDVEMLVGVELRPRVAAMARQALGDMVTIVDGDARAAPLPRARTVLLFDVLQMMPAADQEQLMASIAAMLDEGGVVLVRETDAAAGWGFIAVRVGNRLKAIVTGNWRQGFHFRTVAEWTACFERLGFHVARQDAGDGTPFANVLFVLTAPRRPAITSPRPGAA